MKETRNAVRTLIGEFDVVVEGSVKRIRKVEVSTFVTKQVPVTEELHLCMITYMGKDLHQEWLTHEQQVDLIKGHHSKDYYFLGETKEAVGTYKAVETLESTVIEEEDITKEYEDYLADVFNSEDFWI